MTNPDQSDTTWHLANNVPLFCIILIFVGSIGSLTVDMYVPAMPDIARSLAITPSAIKLTITLYLITYAIGQLFYGTLIDCYGRKRVLMFAICIGLIGSICCFLANSISMLYAGRLLQGAGYAAVGASLPAIARDVLEDKQFARVGSMLSLAFGLGPILSPILGGYIAHYFGWRMTFVFIAAYTVAALSIVVLVIPETLDKHKRHVFHISPILSTYSKIIRNRYFVANALSKAIAYTGFIVFYTVTPFMFQKQLGLTPVQYGWITLALTGSSLLAKFVNTILLKHIDINRLIIIPAFINVFAGCLLLLLAALGYYSMAAILIPFIIFGIGSGFLFSNATVAAFQPFKGVSAGSVSGLINSTQLLSAFVGSAIAAHLDITTLLPLGIFMAAVTIIAATQYVILSRGGATAAAN